MKKSAKILIFLALLMLICTGLFVIYLINSNSPKVIRSKILFSKTESWGPCMGKYCGNKTILYNNGLFVSGGSKKSVRFIFPGEMKNIKDKVIQTNILNKECIEGLVLDYSAEYYINLNGDDRVLKYPSCSAEIREIENIFD